jgi:hypothetical protein
MEIQNSLYIKFLNVFGVLGVSQLISQSPAINHSIGPFPVGCKFFLGNISCCQWLFRVANGYFLLVQFLVWCESARSFDVLHAS